MRSTRTARSASLQREPCRRYSDRYSVNRVLATPSQRVESREKRVEGESREKNSAATSTLKRRVATAHEGDGLSIGGRDQ